jgi:hypothetical protein
MALKIFEEIKQSNFIVKWNENLVGNLNALTTADITTDLQFEDAFKKIVKLTSEFSGFKHILNMLRIIVGDNTESLDMLKYFDNKYNELLNFISLVPLVDTKPVGRPGKYPGVDDDDDIDAPSDDDGYDGNDLDKIQARLGNLTRRVKNNENTKKNLENQLVDSNIDSSVKYAIQKKINKLEKLNTKTNKEISRLEAKIPKDYEARKALNLVTKKPDIEIYEALKKNTDDNKIKEINERIETLKDILGKSKETLRQLTSYPLDEESKLKMTAADKEIVKLNEIIESYKRIVTSTVPFEAKINDLITFRNPTENYLTEPVLVNINNLYSVLENKLDAQKSAEEKIKREKIAATAENKKILELNAKRDLVNVRLNSIISMYKDISPVKDIIEKNRDYFNKIIKAVSTKNLFEHKELKAHINKIKSVLSLIENHKEFEKRVDTMDNIALDKLLANIFDAFCDPKELKSIIDSGDNLVAETNSLLKRAVANFKRAEVETYKNQVELILPESEIYTKAKDIIDKRSKLIKHYEHVTNIEKNKLYNVKYYSDIIKAILTIANTDIYVGNRYHANGYYKIVDTTELYGKKNSDIGAIIADPNIKKIISSSVIIRTPVPGFDESYKAVDIYLPAASMPEIEAINNNVSLNRYYAAYVTKEDSYMYPLGMSPSHAGHSCKAYVEIFEDPAPNNPVKNPGMLIMRDLIACIRYLNNPIHNDMFNIRFNNQALETPLVRDNDLAHNDSPLYGPPQDTVKKCMERLLEYMNGLDLVFKQNKTPGSVFNDKGVIIKTLNVDGLPARAGGDFINKSPNLNLALLKVSMYIKQLIVFFRAAKPMVAYFNDQERNDMTSVDIIPIVSAIKNPALKNAYDNAILVSQNENNSKVYNNAVRLRRLIPEPDEELDRTFVGAPIYSRTIEILTKLSTNATIGDYGDGGLTLRDAYDAVGAAEKELNDMIDQRYIVDTDADFVVNVLDAADAADNAGEYTSVAINDLFGAYKDAVDAWVDKFTAVHQADAFGHRDTMNGIIAALGIKDLDNVNDIATVGAFYNMICDGGGALKGTFTGARDASYNIVINRSKAFVLNAIIATAETALDLKDLRDKKKLYLNNLENATLITLNTSIYNKCIKPISTYCADSRKYADLINTIVNKNGIFDTFPMKADNAVLVNVKKHANVPNVTSDVNGFKDGIVGDVNRLQMPAINYNWNVDIAVADVKYTNTALDGCKYLYQIDADVLNYPLALLYVKEILIANAADNALPADSAAHVKSYSNAYSNSGKTFIGIFDIINIYIKDGDTSKEILEKFNETFRDLLIQRVELNTQTEDFKKDLERKVEHDNTYNRNYSLDEVKLKYFTVSPEWFNDVYDAIMRATVGDGKAKGGAPAIPAEIIKIIGLTPSVNQNTYTLLNDIWCSLFGAIIATHEFNAKQNSTAKSVLSTKKKQFLVIHGGARTLDENGNEVYSSQINVNPDLVELYYNMLSLTMYYINNLTAPGRTNKSITITNFRIEENFSEFITLMQSSTYVEKRKISDLGVSDLEVFVNLVNNVYAKYTNSNEELESIFKRIIIDYRDSVSKHIVIMTDEEVSLLESSRGYDAPDVINVNQLYGGEYDLVRKPLAPSNKFLAPTQLEYEIKNKYSIHMYKDLLLKFINQIVESADETSNKISLRSSFQECAQKISNTRYEEKLTILSDFLTKGIISTSDTLQTQMFVHEFITWPCKVLKDLGNYLSGFINITDKTPQYDALFVYGTEELVSFARSENLNTFNFNKAEQLFKSMYETINKIYIESTAYLSKSARENCDREIRKVEKLYTTLFTSHQDYVKSTTEYSLNHIARRIVNNPLVQNAMNVNINSINSDLNNDLNKTKKDVSDGKVSWIQANEDVIMSKNNIVGHFNTVVVQYLLDLYNVGESKIISEFVNNFYGAISANKNFLRTDEDVLTKPSSYVTNTVYNMLNYIKNCKIAGKPDIITDDITSSISITSKSNLPPIMAYYRYVFTCISRAADNLDQLYNEQNTQVFYAIKNYCGILIGGINTVSELILEGSTKKVFNTDDTYMSNAIFTPFTITNLLGNENLTVQSARQYYSLCRFMFYGGNSSVEPKWFRLDKSEFKFNNSLLKPEIDSIIDSNYYNNLVLLSRHNYYVTDKDRKQPYDVNTAISYTRNSIMENAIKKYLKNANEISGSATPTTAFDKDSNKITCVVCPLNPKYLMQYVPFYNIIAYSYLYEQLVSNVKDIEGGNAENLRAVLSYNHENGPYKGDKNYDNTVNYFKADKLLSNGLSSHKTYVSTIIGRIKVEAEKERSLLKNPTEYFKFSIDNADKAAYNIDAEFADIITSAKLKANGVLGDDLDTIYENKCKTPFNYIVGHKDVKDDSYIKNISDIVIKYVKDIEFESDECFALLGRPYRIVDDAAAGNPGYTDTQLSRAVVQFCALLLVDNVSSYNGTDAAVAALATNIVAEFTNNRMGGRIDDAATIYTEKCKFVDNNKDTYLTAATTAFDHLKNMNKTSLKDAINAAVRLIPKAAGTADSVELKSRKANIIKAALEKQFKIIKDLVVEILMEPGADLHAVARDDNVGDANAIQIRKNVGHEVLDGDVAGVAGLRGLMNIVDAKRIIHGLPIELIDGLKKYNVEFVRTVLMMRGKARDVQRAKYIKLCQRIPQLITGVNINNALPSTYIGARLIGGDNIDRLYKYIYTEDELITYLKNIPKLFGSLEYGVSDITSKEFHAISNGKLNEYINTESQKAHNEAGGDDPNKKTAEDNKRKELTDKFSRPAGLKYIKLLAKAMLNNTTFTVCGVLNGDALETAEKAIETIREKDNTLIRQLAVEINGEFKIDDEFDTNPATVAYEARYVNGVADNTDITTDKDFNNTSESQKKLAASLMASPTLNQLHEYCTDKDLIKLESKPNTVLTLGQVRDKFATFDKDAFRNMIVLNSYLDAGNMDTTILLRVVLTVCKSIDHVLKRIDTIYNAIMENVKNLKLNTYSCLALSLMNTSPQLAPDIFAYRFMTNATDADANTDARTHSKYNFLVIDGKTGIENKVIALNAKPYDVLPNYDTKDTLYIDEFNASKYYALARVVIEYLNNKEIINLYTPSMGISDVTGVKPRTLSVADVKLAYKNVFKDKELEKDGLDIIIHIVKISIVHQILESLSVEKLVTNNIIAKRNEMLISSPVTFKE